MTTLSYQFNLIHADNIYSLSGTAENGELPELGLPIFVIETLQYLASELTEVSLDETGTQLAQLLKASNSGTATTAMNPLCVIESVAQLRCSVVLTRGAHAVPVEAMFLSDPISPTQIEAWVICRINDFARRLLENYSRAAGSTFPPVLVILTDTRPDDGEFDLFRHFDDSSGTTPPRNRKPN
jgi:hypothetical protein